MKFSPLRTQVASVACPAVITAPWLMVVSSTPTISAIRTVRRRLCGVKQKATASRPAAMRFDATGRESATRDRAGSPCFC